MTSSMRRRPRADLVEALARGLGKDAARVHVDTAADALGCGADLDAEEALRVLERLALEPGLVGVAARFAKARVHLNWE